MIVFMRYNFIGRIIYIDISIVKVGCSLYSDPGLETIKLHLQLRFLLDVSHLNDMHLALIYHCLFSHKWFCNV